MRGLSLASITKRSRTLTTSSTSWTTSAEATYRPSQFLLPDPLGDVLAALLARASKHRYVR
jgi:hypothetical protein